MILFKDISYAQGAFNMDGDPDQAVAMKASGFYTGSKLPYLDDQLVRNYSDAIRLGKVPILYHFAGGGDAQTEANYFIAAASPLAEGDVYALDWEIEHDNPVGWVSTFMQTVHNATGVWPLLYIDIDRLNRFDWTSVLSNCGLWCAAPSYGFDATLPVKYTVVAQQGPIVNGVDTDAFFGTLEELKEYAYHTQAIPTPTTTPVSPTPAPPIPTPAPTPPAPDPVPVAPTPQPVSAAPATPVTLKVIVGPKTETLLERIIAFLKLIFIGKK